MMDSDKINFERIATAIEYIRDNFRFQPSLDEVAEKVHLSPFHFQRMFTEWAGVSPKKFLQYISIEHAKKILKDKQSTLFEAALDTGLSGTGRLHDLFIHIEGMTPGEYKNGGENLIIRYSFSESPFGEVMLASTSKGVCYMAFADDNLLSAEELKRNFPCAEYQEKTDDFQQQALSIFLDNHSPGELKLHLKGTGFQLKVWEALLKIPAGQLATYGEIARNIDCPRACRAVGSAIGDNPVAFIIPCHRVIQSGGNIGNYHWGSTRKLAMIGWEAARKDQLPVVHRIK